MLQILRILLQVRLPQILKSRKIVWENLTEQANIRQFAKNRLRINFILNMFKMPKAQININ